jgi:hypothetical protein
MPFLDQSLYISYQLADVKQEGRGDSVTIGPNIQSDR